jgi:glutamine synthetase
VNCPDAATIDELDTFLADNPSTQMMEVLSPDLSGILRGKRIPRQEFETFFRSGLKSPGSSALMDTTGDICDLPDIGMYEGDPDRTLYPVAGTLSAVPWLQSRPAQVIASYSELSGEAYSRDPRDVLRRAMQPLLDMGLRPVVATEAEFYLLEPGESAIPRALLGKVPGTDIRQPGVQFGMLEDLWDVDGFLEAVRTGATLQNLPITTVLSEFSGGQFEINLHHLDDVIKACDQALLLKRLIKGAARQYGLGSTFMAKPFAEMAGNGLHIHVSLYDEQGNNILADPSSTAKPAISQKMRHAVGGLVDTMADNMAVFAPNANSYRRLILGNYAPVNPSWGYNHRCVSLRIPVSGQEDTRIEHRVAGADANPYLVMAAVMAGLHHGLTHQCDPGEMIVAGQVMPEEKVTLPIRWEGALERFKQSQIMPRYWGDEYHRIYSTVKEGECETYHRMISPLDYEYYLRAV